jgi:Flp pilus assembly protein TadD
MPGRWRALVFTGAFALAGCASPKPPATAASGGAPAIPSWLPAYSVAQQKLLAPVDQPIQTPAARIYPDLERFGYAANRQVTSLEEPLKLTKMIATILEESPRFYSLEEAGPELANTVAQYGPANAAESDGWSSVLRARGGEAALRPLSIAGAVRADFIEGEKLLASRQPAGAIDAFRKAASGAPGAPAVHAALARALLVSGQTNEAEAEVRRGIALDPTFAPFHVELAEIAESKQDRSSARDEIAEALAYQPTSPRALEVAHRLGDAGLRVRPMAIFLDVDAVGAIHVATAAGTAAQMYGGCRAVMRYEPEVRSALSEQPPETPYHLSVMEEVLCLEAALGAYLFDRSKDPSLEVDPALEALLELAHDEGLLGYVMFEILGQHRPERARLAPLGVHQAMVGYISKHVLGEGVEPEGLYIAWLDWGAACGPEPRLAGRTVR